MEKKRRRSPFSSCRQLHWAGKWSESSAAPLRRTGEGRDFALTAGGKNKLETFVCSRSSSESVPGRTGSPEPCSFPLRHPSQTKQPADYSQRLVFALRPHPLNKAGACTALCSLPGAENHSDPDEALLASPSCFPSLMVG